METLPTYNEAIIKMLTAHLREAIRNEDKGREFGYRRGIKAFEDSGIEVHSCADLDRVINVRFIGDGMVRKMTKVCADKNNLSMPVGAEVNPHKHYMTREEATDLVIPLTNKLQKLESEYYITGSYRREKPLVGDLDFLIVSDTTFPKGLERFLVSEEKQGNIVISAQGDKKIKLVWQDKIEIDFRCCPKKYLGSHLLYFTGSGSFNVHLRSEVKKRGMKLSEYGITTLDDGKLHTFKTEKGIFKFLNMEYVAPCERV